MGSSTGVVLHTWSHAGCYEPPCGSHEAAGDGLEAASGSIEARGSSASREYSREDRARRADGAFRRQIVHGRREFGMASFQKPLPS